MAGKPKAGGLSARDHQIAALIASGVTYGEAGERLKLCERTIRRAMEREEVRKEVDAIRTRSVEAGLGVLCESFTTAARELVVLVREGRATDAVRLGAVKLVIEAALKTREHVSLTREIEELRRALDEPPGGSSPPPEDRGGPQGGPGGSGEPDRAPSGPGSSSDASGHTTGPVAGSAIEGPVDTVPSAGESSVWKI